MDRKIFFSLFTVLILFFSTNISVGIQREKNISKNIWINDIQEKNIKVNILNIEVNNEDINIGEEFNAFAIITMNVENKGDYDIELSNIDVYPYQNKKNTKYFVSTCNDNITGFLGNLKSKESKIIKIGVALYDRKNPVTLEFLNVEDKANKKTIETISIK